MRAFTGRAGGSVLELAKARNFRMVNERIVLEYYLGLMDEDKIEFLPRGSAGADSVASSVRELMEAEGLHRQIEVAKRLWKRLFESAMGQIDGDRHGYDDLFSYFDEFVEFEELIFASDSFYRDHTVHCLWVYFLGEYLYRRPEFGFFFHDMMEDYKKAFAIIDGFVSAGLLEPDANVVQALGSLVKLDEHQGAVRCVVALTHDLGYPLKKIDKINHAISRVMPHFSIENYQRFSFAYTTSQLPFIEKFLELLSMDFSVDIFGTFPRRLRAVANELVVADDSGALKINVELLAHLELADREALIEAVRPTLSIVKGVPRYMRYADDFERQQHGIMSAYLLAKNLRFFKTMRFTYTDSGRLSVDNVDFHKVNAGTTILSAVADHTSPGFRIRRVNSASALLTMVDELEEFSRISRADQNRQYVSQFCKTDLYADGGWLCIDFIFDNDELGNLDPERAFKGRCKRFLSLFDVENLDQSVKIRLRCLGRLAANDKSYMLELARGLVRIVADGAPRQPGEYLKTRHY